MKTFHNHSHQLKALKTRLMSLQQRLSQNRAFFTLESDLHGELLQTLQSVGFSRLALSDIEAAGKGVQQEIFLALGRLAEMELRLEQIDQNDEIENLAPQAPKPTSLTEHGHWHGTFEKVPQSLAQRAVHDYHRFFTEDLYGRLNHKEDNLILSSGALHEDLAQLPLVLKAATNFAIQKNWYGYSDTAGIGDVRQALADWENAKISEHLYTRENTFVSLGGTAAITLIFETLRQTMPEKDEIIFVLPSYAPFMAAAEKHFRVRYIRPVEAQLTHVPLSQILKEVSNKTAAVFLVDVNNPLGTKLPEKELATLAAGCAERGVRVILDEIGKCFLDPQPEVSRVTHPGTLVRVNSISKALGAPGLKVGHVVAEKEFITALARQASGQYGAPNSVFYLLYEMLARFEQFRCENLAQLGERELSLFRTDYGLNLCSLQMYYTEYCGTVDGAAIKIRSARKRVVRELQGLEGDIFERVVVPQGSLNVCVKLKPEFCYGDSYETALRILREAQISVFPGSCFGLGHDAESGEMGPSGQWLRITISAEPNFFRTLAKFIEFFKAKDTYIRLNRHPGLHLAVIQLGQFTADPTLNFLSHLFDVRRVAHALALAHEKKHGTKLNLQALELGALLHDSGKVWATRSLRRHRARYLQRRYPHGVPAHITQAYTYEERGGSTRDGLDRDGAHTMPFRPPLSDVYHTRRIIQRVLQNSEGFSPTESALIRNLFWPQKSQAHLSVERSLLDVADKIADNPKDTLQVEALVQSLADKEEYVLWRYGRDAQLLGNALKWQQFQQATHHEFSQARHFVQQAL